MPCIDRLPAIPLLASDPYLSIWMPADTMTQTDACHWSGPAKPIRGVLTVDGAACRFLGAGPEPEADLTGAKVTPVPVLPVNLPACGLRPVLLRRLFRRIWICSACPSPW
ncbi:MAG: DUF4964 domain-containing protein [Ruthenibacterium lactatiformans]